jgi:hypothetical protein
MLAPGADALPLEAPLAQYRAQGFAQLGRVLSEDALQALRARADALMLGQVVHEGLFFQHDSASGRYDELPLGRGYLGPSLRYRKLEKLELDPLFRAAIENALFARIAQAVIGPDVALCRAVLFNKAAQGGTELPWHQDGGAFWGLSRDPVLQIWTALDDAPAEAGCVEAVPGSHLGGLVTPMGGVIAPDRVQGARAVLLPARAGEAMLLHNHLWHRSGVNRTGAPRRALTVCLMDAATRCTRRKRPRQFLRLFAGASR